MAVHLISMMTYIPDSFNHSFISNYTWMQVHYNVVPTIAQRRQNRFPRDTFCFEQVVKPTTYINNINDFLNGGVFTRIT